jgi:hypothetical protein
MLIWQGRAYLDMYNHPFHVGSKPNMTNFTDKSKNTKETFLTNTMTYPKSIKPNKYML